MHSEGRKFEKGVIGLTEIIQCPEGHMSNMKIEPSSTRRGKVRAKVECQGEEECRFVL